MITGKKAYAAATTYVDECLKEVGALRGKPCTIKETEHKDGRTKIVFEWTANDDTTRETTIYVYDGTPIYVWEPGNEYKFGDLAIYESAFYRCITENSDIVFDDTKWNEIGSTDGSYDIVQNKALLPPYFTAADRKLYYSIDENIFYLWDGTGWKPQTEVVQYTTLPLARELFKDRIVQYIGADTPVLTSGFFYKCVHDTENDTYSWQNVETQEVEELTTEQMETLLAYL